MEWWQLWVPFIGTIISLFFTIRAGIKQSKNSEEFEKKMIQQSNEIAKKAEIRKVFSVYIIEIEKSLQIFQDFMEKKAKFEDNSNFLSSMLQDGINPDHSLGHNPREEMVKLDVELCQLKLEWESCLKSAKLALQELLLHFKSDDEQEKIEKLLTSLEQRIGGLNWVFSTNLPRELIFSTIDLKSLDEVYKAVKKEMRNLLNG